LRILGRPDDARSARRQTSLIERVNIGALKTQIEPHAIAVDRNGWESIIMRQHRGLHFVGVLGLLACAGWSQPASAQATAITSSPPLSPFGDCNTTDPKTFDAEKFRTLDDDGKKSLLKSGLPCAEAARTDLGGSLLESLQRSFDFNSWLTFIALNAPTDKTLDITTARPATRTVWEDGEKFIPLLDVMLPGGAKPDWKKRAVPPACRAQHDADPSLMVVQMIEESFNQPFRTGPLIDQNNNYAIFDILMNRAMFDLIVSDKNPLYSRALQASEQNANLRVDFPSGRSKDDPLGPPGHGSIMIKVSWKILAGDDDRSKFHHVEALVAMPTTEDQQMDPPCLRKTLGLIGFHVVHKTQNRPQWIWTSFEHKDNVPEQRDIDAFRSNTDPNKKGPKYNFYTLSCSDSDCPVNETPPRPWDPEPANALQFRRNSQGQMIFNSQIVRTVPLTEATHVINRQFHGVLGDNVWSNYILIGTQWPSDFNCATRRSELQGAPSPRTDFDKQPDMNCAPAPTFLANSTLETYSQGEIPQASSSCMGCHGNATSYIRRTPSLNDQQNPAAANDNERRRQMFMNQSDFTFMLEKAR
jgi:hypothetical protein